MKKLTLLIAALFSILLLTAAPTSGLVFPGTSGAFIDLSSTATSPTQFTIESWVCYSSLPTGESAYIMSTEESPAGAQGFSLRANKNQINLCIGNANWVSVTGKTVLQVGTWYHIAATCSSTDIKVYVNGVLDGTATISPSMVVSGKGLRIGESPSWTGRLFNGVLSDLRFWNRPRTESEIASTMSTSLTGSEEGLIANWKMNEGQGTAVADVKGLYPMIKPALLSWFHGTTGITVTGNNITTLGGTSQMNAEILPETASKNISWSVNDPSIATIGTTGLLTAQRNGTVTVTATSNDGSKISGSTQIVVSNQTAPSKLIYIDFGPTDSNSGKLTVSPDANGNYWNNATDNLINATLALVDKTNAATGVSLSNVTVFQINPTNSVMALTNPTTEMLGDLAVGTATQDFFFSENTIRKLKISGLNKNKAYKFKVFGSRVATDTRVSKYTFTGANSDFGTLQTSGTNLGGTGINGNNSTIYASSIIYPDANGEVMMELSNVTSTFGYLNLMKIEEYDASMVKVTSINVSGSAITTANGTIQLTAEVLPSNATIKEVSWTVSDPSIATLNAKAQLTAQKNGTVQVVATTKETGSIVTGRADIVVSNQLSNPSKQVFIDFGPNDVTNGTSTTNPDVNGNYWNNANNETQGATLSLIDDTNAPTGFTFTVTGGMSKNGIQNGGLLAPKASYLGEFAIASATQDYFYTNTSGQFKLTNLNVNKAYNLSVFGSRDATDNRITEYTFTGKNVVKATNQTSGIDLGGVGANGNNSTILKSGLIYPNANGEIVVDLLLKSGAFAHINVLKLEEYDVQLVDVTAITVSGNNITTSGTPSQMSADVLPANASIKDVSWTVSDTEIASIDQTGLLRPLNNGQVTVTATTKQSGLTVKGSKLITISNQFTELYLSGTATENGNNPATALPMTKVTDLQGGSNGVFELYTNLSTEGTLNFYSSKEAGATVYGAGTTAGTVLSAGSAIDPTVSGLVLISVNLLTKTYSITPINQMGIIGNAGEILLENKGKGVFSSVVDMSKVITAANKTFSFRANADWKYTFKSVVGSVNSFRMESQALSLGIPLENIATDLNNFTVSIDLNTYTYTVTCPLIDKQKITIMGSSVAYGTGATSNQGYNYKYAQLLTQRHTAGQGEDWILINKSIGGNTTQMILDRWNSDLVSQCGKYVIYALSMANEGLHESATKQVIFDRFKTNIQLLIDKSRAKGMIPVLVNNYVRADYTTEDYAFIKQMDMLIHEWDVPSINSLGSVDDGLGHWAVGFQNDNGHPNDAGHTEFMLSMVPSMFDALDAGKPLPTRATGMSMDFDNTVQPTQLTYTPDNTVHPFTISFDVKSTGNGIIASFKNGVKYGTLSIDPTTGAVVYLAPSGKMIAGKVAVNDGQWHKVTLTHYYAKGKTLLYTDNTLEGNLVERLLASEFYLNDSKAPAAVSYRDLFFYRSGMNALEIDYLNQGKMLKSSLDLYAPLDGRAASVSAKLANLAQSTTTLKLGFANGVDRLLNTKWSICPNPVTDKLIVSGLDEHKVYDAVIYGMDGRSVLKETLENGRVLTVSHLPTSQYVLVLNEKNSTEKEKLIFNKK